MNEKQKENAVIIIDAMSNSENITPAMMVGILCVVAKESGLITRNENSYSRTSNKRIKKIFGRKKLGRFYSDDSALTDLKKKRRDFFDQVYGGRGGNNRQGDGWRYRGRGFNQLTFKSAYRSYSTPDFDLVKRPWLLDRPSIAALVVTEFFNRAIRRNKRRIENRFGTDNCDTETELIENAVLMAANINAGLGKPAKSTSVQRAFRHAMKHVGEMCELVEEYYQ